MNESAVIFNVVSSVIGVAGLLWLLLFLWPAHRLDAFRQDLFLIRDELFDYAANGKIDMAHPAYQLLRQNLNGYLRYAHHLSFFQVTMKRWQDRAFAHEPKYVWSERWQRALKAIPDQQVKADLENFHLRTSLAVGKRLIIGSPLLLASFIVVSLGFVAGFSAAWAWRDLKRRASRKVLNDWVDSRLLDEEAASCAV